MIVKKDKIPMTCIKNQEPQKEGQTVLRAHKLYNHGVENLLFFFNNLIFNRQIVINLCSVLGRRIFC